MVSLTWGLSFSRYKHQITTLPSTEPPLLAVVNVEPLWHDVRMQLRQKESRQMYLHFQTENAATPASLDRILDYRKILIMHVPKTSLMLKSH